MDNGISSHFTIGHFSIPACSLGKKALQRSLLAWKQSGLRFGANSIYSQPGRSRLATLLRHAFASGKISQSRPIWKQKVSFGV
jgi:hypothetical protein